MSHDYDSPYRDISGFVDEFGCDEVWGDSSTDSTLLNLAADICEQQLPIA